MDKIQEMGDVREGVIRLFTGLGIGHGIGREWDRKWL